MPPALDLIHVLATGRRPWSLRLRVAVAILLAALAPLFIVVAWSQLDRNVLGRMWSETLRASQVSAAVVALDAEHVDGSRLAALAREHRVWLRVVDPQGNVAFDLDADDPNDRFGELEEKLLGASTLTLRELDETRGVLGERGSVAAARAGRTWIACDTLPLLYCESAASAGRLVVHVQRSSRRAVQSVYALRAQLLRLALFTVPIALVIALYTGRRIVRPVEHLRRQALALSAVANAGAALDPEKRDEVGALAEAFNVLLQALEKKRAENEAFVADLVHELKNPVAAVRATAESLAGGAVDADRASRLARVLGDSSAKLDQLVTQFLELARADAGMPNEERAPVDLAALVDGAVSRMKDDPRHRQTRFEARLPEPTHTHASVMGVPHRLEALVRELLENGASFAGAGGYVEAAVSVDATRQRVTLSIADSGPGIPPTDLPHVFERFFTTRGARRGTGLGLALVRAVALAHGGEVSVESSGGTTFVVRLPLLP